MQGNSNIALKLLQNRHTLIGLLLRRLNPVFAGAVGARTPQLPGGQQRLARQSIPRLRGLKRRYKLQDEPFRDADAANVAAPSQSAEFPPGKGQEDRGINGREPRNREESVYAVKASRFPGGLTSPREPRRRFITLNQMPDGECRGWKSPGGPADSAHLALTAQGRSFETDGSECIRT
jgi:hypothetical protein